jgi:hypothetical protein
MPTMSALPSRWTVCGPQAGLVEHGDQGGAPPHRSPRPDGSPRFGQRSLSSWSKETSRLLEQLPSRSRAISSLLRQRGRRTRRRCRNRCADPRSLGWEDCPVEITGSGAEKRQGNDTPSDVIYQGALDVKSAGRVFSRLVCAPQGRGFHFWARQGTARRGSLDGPGISGGDNG